MMPSNSGAPTLRQLELLLSLENAEGIASAGAKLGMTASATSHCLRALEDALGSAVIDRNAHGVELSHAGRQILPHVRDLFAAMQLIQATARASAGLESGQLRIGSFGPSSSLKLLPPLVADFRARYPGVEVFVTERSDPEIEQDLQDRRIEIGVVTLPKPELETLPLAVDEMTAVLPRDHVLAESDPVALRDLVGYPLILTHAGSQALVTKMLSRADVRPRITHELSQLMSILEFVARGQGVSIVASMALPETYPGVVYRRITPRASRRVALACLNEARLSPAAAAFWEHARHARRVRHPR
jgi:DNA-binding transcriptional LysR family regulator